MQSKATPESKPTTRFLSYPSSAWARTFPKLCFELLGRSAPRTHGRRESQGGERKQSFRNLRSQAELGTEGNRGKRPLTGCAAHPCARRDSPRERPQHEIGTPPTVDKSRKIENDVLHGNPPSASTWSQARHGTEETAIQR